MKRDTLKVVFGVVVFLGLIGVASAQAKGYCGATVFSSAEAKRLVMSVPQAIASVRAGGEVEVIKWQPGDSYRTKIFYFYMLLTNRGGARTTLLDNGVIGYFGVNKFTGRVVDALYGNETVKGRALLKLQSELRSQHCVSKSLVVRYEKIPPEEGED